VQINRTGYFLLALFFFGGLLFLALNFFVFSTEAFLLIGIIWPLVSIGLGIYALQQRERGRHDRWLFENGLRARGTLVDASVGATINEQPLMHLVLDVEGAGMDPRRVERRLIVSDFASHRMRPGVTLPVYVNPTDPEDLLIVW
jgi:hypothetical protein